MKRREPTLADYRRPLRGLTPEGIRMRHRIATVVLLWYADHARCWIDPKTRGSHEEGTAMIGVVCDLFPDVPPKRLFR